MADNINLHHGPIFEALGAMTLSKHPDDRSSAARGILEYCALDDLREKVAWYLKVCPFKGPLPSDIDVDYDIQKDAWRQVQDALKNAKELNDG